MAYNHPSYGSRGPPSFNDNMSQDELRGQADLDLNGDWLAQIDPSLNQIDPSLLGYPTSAPVLAPMTFQVQQQVHLQSQEYQQQPIQRFMSEPNRNLFTTTQVRGGGQVFTHGLNRPGAPIQSLPEASFIRHASPSFSQGLSSTCTSAQSPGAEFDWNPENRYYSQGGMDFYAQSPPSYANSPPPFDSAPVHYQQYALPQVAGNSCVNMSQVQGFADPQEVTFEADEGYDELAMNMDPSEKQYIKTESHHPEFQDDHYHTDSAVGSSIKDANSPENTSMHATDDVDAASDMDADADGEADNDMIEVDPASDTEYTPRSTRTRKRPSTTTKSSLSTSKRGNGRISKSSHKSNGKLSCKSCDVPPFKDATLLARHIASAHTRAFICVFAFAGCGGTFTSKNEWKRHVSSQHLNLTAWVCELGSCGRGHGHNHVPAKTSSAPNGAAGKGGSEFNRKDLFTQHLRRMHAPHMVKRKKQTDETWEKELKGLQVSCLKVKRQAPVQLRCPVQECVVTFEGQTCWDDRMEHVGKHLERAASAGERDVGKVVDQGRDELLVRWALKERIVEERPGGGLRLVVGKREVDDEDAEGEME
ncbi:hypothetical protein EG329_007709 [Mollisiaceae sp. DMI_Dod_QoI]|nr:hypothetical protein EG329_007709 [Helotiales sp. DMI_Dod_QoI]